jgi:hypothetical protein
MDADLLHLFIYLFICYISDEVVCAVVCHIQNSAMTDGGITVTEADRLSSLRITTNPDPVRYMLY